MVPVRYTFFLAILLELTNLIHAQQYDSILVVSDLDNTLKITRGKNGFQTLSNLFFHVNCYDSMPELYQNWEKQGAQLLFLTNQNRLSKRNTCKMLNRVSLANCPVLFRSFFERGRRHKLRALHKLIIRYPNKYFILIGDNDGKDAPIYSEIQDLYPKQIKAVYIRSINPEKSLHNASSFKDVATIIRLEKMQGRVVQLK